MSSNTSPRAGFRLRSLGWFARLGLAAMVLTLLGGSAASGFYLYLKYEKRDERPGLTLDDIRGHYHGIRSEAPMIRALSDGSHDQWIDEAIRKDLLDWLSLDNPLGEYENIDLYVDSPRFMLEDSCLSCHSPTATGDNAAPEISLINLEQVAANSQSREILPVNMTILAASTHTHALSLAVLAMVMAGLFIATSWPRFLTGPIVALTGLALLADIGSWWLTRDNIAFAPVIAIAGTIFNGGVGLMGVMILLDLCLPRIKPAPASA